MNYLLRSGCGGAIVMQTSESDFNGTGGNMVKTLIVVDMQKDFIDGSLGTPEAVHIVSRVQAKILAYRENGDEVIFTRDTHGPDYMETNEGKRLPVVHCIKGTVGWNIPAELDFPECEHIDKPSFGWTKWDRVCENGAEVPRKPFEEIEMIGVCTDICVVSNALILKALYPEVPMKVDASCCAGVTPEKHDAALEVLRSCQIEVVGA